MSDVASNYGGEMEVHQPPSGGCFNCGEDGHMKSECPHPRTGNDACFNCGEPGHMKFECPNPRIERAFEGECRVCGGEGHRASECSDIKRVYEDSIPILAPEQGWQMLLQADKARDMVLIKHALSVYTRAMPSLTFADMEKELRSAGLNVHIIAKEQTLSDTVTVIDLQGVKDRKYVVSLQYSYKPTRPKFAAGWPSSPEENLQRLGNAGYIRDRMVMKCRNCDAIGHTSKGCPEEKKDVAKPELMCGNCKEPGHYMRDCPQPREDHDRPPREPMTCRNCGGEGHKASDCTEERKPKCRNCDEIGHMSKECSKPRDYSRVQCRNCQEYGHTIVRCKQPIVEQKNDEEDAVAADDGNDTTNGHAAGAAEWDNGGHSATADDSQTGAVNGGGDGEWNSGGGGDNGW